MEHKAIKLYLKEGTTIDILFLDGKTKRYDVLKMSKKYSKLNDLKDRKIFLSGKLFGWGGVIWNDELDLDANVIYEDGEDVESEENATEIILGFLIKQARLEKQLTQEELSNLIDIDQADLSKIENGKLCPSLSTIKRISKGLNTSLHIDILS